MAFSFRSRLPLRRTRRRGEIEKKMRGSVCSQACSVQLIGENIEITGSEEYIHVVHCQVTSYVFLLSCTSSWCRFSSELM